MGKGLLHIAGGILPAMCSTTTKRRHSTRGWGALFNTLLPAAEHAIDCSLETLLANTTREGFDNVDDPATVGDIRALHELVTFLERYGLAEYLETPASPERILEAVLGTSDGPGKLVYSDAGFCDLAENLKRKSISLTIALMNPPPISPSTRMRLLLVDGKEYYLLGSYSEQNGWKWEPERNRLWPDPERFELLRWAARQTAKSA